MRTPAQAKPLSIVPKKLYLGVYMARWHAGMFCPIPDHDPPIGAHGSDNVWVLWLVSSLVYLPLMIDLLNDVKLDLHNRCFLGGPASEAANLFALFVIVCGIRSYRFWKLHMGNLKIVLGFTRSVGANEESMSFVVFVRYAAPVNALVEDWEGIRHLRLLIWQPLS